ncbi:conserved hypothetical protein [Neospora caninum Liverpool]|uniref:Uncharacterized protein n=1 Tax=Neospora caninum (strain Liverpool) TaxID=572307 RepID=F0V9N4_NEOCL|nr:conserved hypothetical protein [Neospora caninum Liverpool]CBZ50460.1 conserved hypothetical protein [Neospora caninum Liverpool]CEL65069.1 TPA: hypothetical protein BN1204_009290 [Neospora caninum Liverpool]|eukprot:XP_003880493.1 conserved hypothetical protein [Neospora caninum Liverpool]
MLELLHLKALGILQVVPVPPQIVDCKIGLLDSYTCENELTVEIGGHQLRYSDLKSIFDMLPNYRSNPDKPNEFSADHLFTTFVPNTAQDLGLYTLYNYYLMQDIFFGPVWEIFSTGVDESTNTAPFAVPHSTQKRRIDGGSSAEATEGSSLPSDHNAHASTPYGAEQIFPKLTAVLDAVRVARLLEPVDEKAVSKDRLSSVSTAQLLLDLYLHGREPQEPPQNALAHSEN